MDRQRQAWTCPCCQLVVSRADRSRGTDGRLKKHCGCRALATTGMTPEQVVNHKRQVMIDLKRKYRRQAGARLRVDVAAEAQAKREVIAIKAEIRLQQQKEAPHDAHVKRYAQVISSRAQYAALYARDPQAERDRQSARKQALPDSYVVQNLRVSGMPAEAITPHLIALKRESMEFKRISRALKTAIKNNWKEENEAITKHT